MALTKCPDCGKDMSSFAAACIHCGYPSLQTPPQPSELEVPRHQRFQKDQSAKPTMAKQDQRLWQTILVGIAVLVFAFAVAPKIDKSTVEPPAVSSRPLVDTTKLSKAADSVLQVFTPEVIRRSSWIELTVPRALVAGLPSDPIRTAWLSRVDARVSTLRQQRASTALSTPAPRASDRRYAQSASGGRCASEGGTPASGYQTLVANVIPGKELFLKSDCTPIGVIVDIASDYAFPDGTERDAVLISFRDGSADWIPRKAAQLLYVTR